MGKREWDYILVEAVLAENKTPIFWVLYWWLCRFDGGSTSTEPMQSSAEATSILAQEWEMLLLPPAVKSGQKRRGNPYTAWFPAFNHKKKKKGVGNKGLSKPVCHSHSWHTVKNLEEYSAAGDSLSNSVSLTTIPPLNFSSWRINVYTNRWIQGNLLPSCSKKWVLRFLGPSGTFLTPTAQGF